jgi:hypothetical protein
MLEIFGNILNDSLVNCSVYELVNDEPVLVQEILLDHNQYYANLDYNKTFTLVFEGSDVTKFVYIAPVTRIAIHLNINFDNKEKKHCFYVYDELNQTYKSHIMTDEELREAQKRMSPIKEMY